MSNRPFANGPGEGREVKTWTPPSFDRPEDAPVKPEDAELFEFKPLFISDAERKEEESKAAHLTLEEAKQEASAVMAQAKAEADRLIKEAAKIKADAFNEGKTEGLKKGHAEGYPKGYEDGRQKFETETAPALDAFHQAENLYRDLWSTNEAALVKLAVKVAERIVFHEIQTSPESIVHAFQAAFDTLDEQHEVVFRLHPHDLKTLEHLNEDLRGRVSGLVKVRMEADEGLNRGDVVMETEAGRLDGTLKRRIENVVTAVDEALDASFDLDW